MSEDRKRWLALSFNYLLLYSGLGTLLLFLVFRMKPELCESLYSRGFFLMVRQLQDHIFGWFPFSLFYLILILIIPFLGRRLVKGFKSSETGVLGGIKNTLWLLIGFGSVVVILFYWSWGFNYARRPLHLQMGLTLQALDGDTLLSEVEQLCPVMERTRSFIVKSSMELTPSVLSESWQRDLKRTAAEVFRQFNLPVSESVRFRTFSPGGLLMKFGISGFYFPLTGEPFYSGRLTSAEIPYSAAHEFTHAQGITHEADANFLGMLICVSSRDAMVRYSGQMGYLSTLLSELRKISIPRYRRAVVMVPPPVKADLAASANNWRKYRSWLRKLGRAANHLYLKTQGIKEGIRSYNRFILIYVAYKKKLTHTLLKRLFL